MSKAKVSQRIDNNMCISDPVDFRDYYIIDIFPSELKV